MHIVREVLDKQIVDRDEKKMGRVDGILIRVRDGAPPVVESLELGWVTIAARIHPAIAALVAAAHRRFSVRRRARYHVPWTRVRDVNAHRVQVDVAVDETPAADWEHWLRKHVVEKLPGSDPEQEEK
jgi:hypothetical protein